MYELKDSAGLLRFEWRSHRICSHVGASLANPSDQDPNRYPQEISAFGSAGHYVFLETTVVPDCFAIGI